MTNYFWSSPLHLSEVSLFHLTCLELLARRSNFSCYSVVRGSPLVFFFNDWSHDAVTSNQWPPSQVARVFFLPLGLSYGTFRRFLHGLFSLYKTNWAVRQNVLWEACCRLRQGYTVATGAKQYDLINTTWPLNIPSKQQLFSHSFCQASLSKQQSCREIHLNAALLV